MASERANLTSTEEFLGRVLYELSVLQPLIPTYTHLLLSALFPIFTGAHASLSRPSSAAQAPKRKRGGSDESDVESDEEEESEEASRRMEGLSPSDAIFFPLMAGITLSGLYFIIKWLQDATLLNKVLNWYLSSFGVFSVAKLVTDSLNILASVTFPSRWTDQGVLWEVKSKACEVLSNGADMEDHHPMLRYSPLPGLLSRKTTCPGSHILLWSFRSFFRSKWTLIAKVRGLFSIKVNFGLADVLGLIAGSMTIYMYNFIERSWWLSNAMGFGFCYGALQLLSPTTFWTGTLVLGALFAYDIYFVFFTPLMVTVATKLDVPIKLQFPRPPGLGEDPTKVAMAMLGLGDIVLPGIMIGLALRYDLYLFYLRKQVPKKAQDENQVHDSSEDPSPDSSEHPNGKELVTQTVDIKKIPYRSVSGQWGERLWTRSKMDKSVFPKIYFYAAILGYIIGMLCTLGVMQISGHAQPALLYLVPGVLGSLWGTAAIRGELKEMRDFSDFVEEDDKEKDGKKTKTEGSPTRFDGVKKAETAVKDSERTGAPPKDKSRSKKGANREVFHFSIIAPPAPTSRTCSHSPRPSVTTPTKAQNGYFDYPDPHGTPTLRRSPRRHAVQESIEPPEKRQRRN